MWVDNLKIYAKIKNFYDFLPNKKIAKAKLAPTES